LNCGKSSAVLFHHLPANDERELAYQGRNQEFPMSTRIYLKSGITKEQEPEGLFDYNGERPHVRAGAVNFSSLNELSRSQLQNAEYITVNESFWRGSSGYSFVPGAYEGFGFEVNISPSTSKNYGTDKHPTFDYYQKIFGRFVTLEVGIAFWDALTRGNILPTRPLCRELSVTEQVYARQAAAGVTAMSKIAVLESITAQQAHHIRNLEQLLQGLLTPNNV
jgi:hypothetical protein